MTPIAVYLLKLTGLATVAGAAIGVAADTLIDAQISSSDTPWQLGAGAAGILALVGAMFKIWQNDSLSQEIRADNDRRREAAEAERDAAHRRLTHVLEIAATSDLEGTELRRAIIRAVRIDSVSDPAGG